MTNIHDPEAARENRQRIYSAWITMTNEQRDCLLRLAEHVKALGPNAQMILEYQAGRLAIGAAHGDFDPSRDYRRESVEESADLAHYAIADHLKAQGKLLPSKPKSHPRAAE